MKRLTIRNSDGTVSQPPDLDWVAALERLAVYEDTGLTPEVCTEYRKFEDEIIASGKTFGRLIELLRADKEERIVMLPELPEEKCEDDPVKDLILMWAKNAVDRHEGS